MTSRSPISLASLMNDPTPPPQPQSQSPQSQSQPRSQFPTTTTQTSMQQQSQEPSLQQSDSKRLCCPLHPQKVFRLHPRLPQHVWPIYLYAKDHCQYVILLLSWRWKYHHLSYYRYLNNVD